MTLTKPISDVVQGNPISSTYKPKASELSTLLTEMRDETLPDTAPEVWLAIGQSNLEALASATDGDHSIISDVYLFNTDMSGGTTTAGTVFNEAAFGTAPLNIGSSPYANNAPLHFAQARRKKHHRPQYIIPIGKGGTLIEAWIKPATLTANGWSRGAAQDLSALMYPGIANALALVPGAPTQLTGLIIIHGGANQDELPETYAAKLAAVVSDLGSLIDANTAPIVANGLLDNEGTPNRFRHLNALLRAQDSLKTLRVVKADWFEPVSAGNQHLNGESLVLLGYAMADAVDAAPVRVDYRTAPIECTPDTGLRAFTNQANRAEFDIAKRTAYVPGNALALVNDANLGWAYDASANAAYNIWSRRIDPVPPNGVITVSTTAVTTAVGATVDFDLTVSQWDKDGVFISHSDISTVLTDAMGVTTISGRWSKSGLNADKALNASCAFYAVGGTFGAGANDEAFRFSGLRHEVDTIPYRPITTLSAGTLALAFGSGNNKQVTPNANGTFTTTVPPAGTECRLIILTSGASSYTMTFGTGFKSQGTLATGTTSGKVFALAFLSDGTSLIEIGARGAAM